MPPPQRVHSPEHPVWNLIISRGFRRCIRSTWLFSRCEYFVRGGGGCKTRVVRQSDWDYSYKIPVLHRKRSEIVSKERRKEKRGRRRRSTSPTTTSTTTITTTNTTTRCCPNTFVAFVLLVFLSCVVPLSTPSSPTTTSTTSSTTSTTTTTSSSSFSPPTQPYNNIPICPTARKWISNRGSFCFTLRESPFLKNITELMAREQRAILIFCQMDYILEKIDCAQPYSVNTKQCSMCREAYRDWACAMSTDTLDSGGMDCGRRVMPCPSCASICHQVMRLCPYLTPDRVQYDDRGEAVAHVSQYGGHPAFYCPLENWHASDPAYGESCEKRSDVELNDPDYLHNLCVDPSLALSKRSVEFVKEYKTCCWTYTYSLLSYNRAFEEDATNRVVLNCCDVSGNCEKSDPGNLNLSSIRSSSEGLLRYTNRRTANNQVRTQDGRFRELNSYQADDGEDSYEEYSSGRDFLEYDADNKRVVRETHEFWIETRTLSTSSTSSSSHNTVRAPGVLVLLLSLLLGQVLRSVAIPTVGLRNTSPHHISKLNNKLLVIVVIIIHRVINHRVTKNNYSIYY